MPHSIGQLSAIRSYYSEKLNQHGVSPEGVDWNGDLSQSLRFYQLSTVLADHTNSSKGFVVADLGCGYGALHDHMLSAGYTGFIYHGYDVSEEMCQATRHRLVGHHDVSVRKSNEITEVCDFGIASGIFGVRLDESDERWLAHIFQVLECQSF